MGFIKIEATDLRMVVVHFAKQAWFRRKGKESVRFDVPASYLGPAAVNMSGEGQVRETSFTWPGASAPLRALQIHCGREAFMLLDNGVMVAKKFTRTKQVRQ